MAPDKLPWQFRMATAATRGGGTLVRGAVFAVLVIVWGTVNAWIHPLPTQARARRDLDVLMSQRHLSRLLGKTDASHLRQLSAAADTLQNIRFEDIQVRRPFLDWVFGERYYVIRTVETDPGGTPQVRYYRFSGTGGYETSARAWWLGL